MASNFSCPYCGSKTVGEQGLDNVTVCECGTFLRHGEMVAEQSRLCKALTDLVAMKNGIRETLAFFNKHWQTDKGCECPCCDKDFGENFDEHNETCEFGPLEKKLKELAK